MTANTITDWCRFSRAGSAYIEPGSPWQNPYVESFGGRVRDELLAVEMFSCLTEARVLVEDWRVDYNHNRPHSPLGMMTPVTCAVGWSEAHLAAAPASAELRRRYAFNRSLTCRSFGSRRSRRGERSCSWSQSSRRVRARSLANVRGSRGR